MADTLITPQKDLVNICKSIHLCCELFWPWSWPIKRHWKEEITKPDILGIGSVTVIQQFDSGKERDRKPKTQEHVKMLGLYSSPLYILIHNKGISYAMQLLVRKLIINQDIGSPSPLKVMLLGQMRHSVATLQVIRFRSTLKTLTCSAPQLKVQFILQLRSPAQSMTWSWQVPGGTKCTCCPHFVLSWVAWLHPICHIASSSWKASLSMKPEPDLPVKCC